jgi:PAS domain S-box-containing protein
METNDGRVLDALPGLVWTALPDGRADFVNGRWRDYTGVAFEAACGHGWLCAVHPDDQPGLLAAWERCTASGDPGEREARLRRADGAYRRFLFRASPVTDDAGAIVKWCGLNTDIEDRGRTEEAVGAHERPDPTILDGPAADVTRRSEALTAAILDSALDCIITADQAGRITEFNPAAERTFGYRAGDVVGRPLGEVIVPPSLREQHRRGMARHLATGETRVLGQRVEMTALRADGGEFPVELTIARTPLEGAAFFTGFIRDISERRRTEEQLRRSNAHLAEAQRLSQTGSFTWNAVTNENYWSAEMYRIFEYDPSTEVTPGMVTRQRLHPDDLPLVEALLAKAAAGENFDVDCRAVMPTGQLKYLHVIGHKEQDRDAGPEFLGAVQDVTQRKLAEEALGRARSELTRMARVTSLGALTASIAHEVNQPLAGIITNANTCLKMLAAEAPDLEGARETARRTVRDGNRAADVIRRLRALFAQQAPTSEPVDLNEVASEVIALSWSDLQRSRVIVRTELADGLPRVDGDRVQLQQVILNLILNAADAMGGIVERPRQLVIETWSDGADRATLAVRDVGVGLGPGPPEKLFEAFYTTKAEGMGIGLSISRSIIEHHGGALWAAPNAGPGATFAFSIPLAPPGASRVEAPGVRPGGRTSAAGPPPPRAQRPDV